MLKIDEINLLYDYTDRVIETLNRRYISVFNKLKGIYSLDEKSVIKAVNEAYSNIDEITLAYFLLLARKIYKRMTDDGDLSEYWLLAILDEYNPITKYVYRHELDRKRARLIEALIASDEKTKEVDKAKKLWARQARQYADIVTDKAILKVYNDNDILDVVWVTEDDIKVCRECYERDGKVYRIDNIPPKPHYGCRCWVEPYVFKGN